MFCLIRLKTEEFVSMLSYMGLCLVCAYSGMVSCCPHSKPSSFQQLQG